MNLRAAGVLFGLSSQIINNRPKNKILFHNSYYGYYKVESDVFHKYNKLINV